MPVEKILHNLSHFCPSVRQRHQLPFIPHNFSFVQETALKHRDSGSLHFSGTENFKSRKEECSCNIWGQAIGWCGWSLVREEDRNWQQAEEPVGQWGLCHVGFWEVFTLREVENDILVLGTVVTWADLFSKKSLWLLCLEEKEEKEPFIRTLQEFRWEVMLAGTTEGSVKMARGIGIGAYFRGSIN